MVRLGFNTYHAAGVSRRQVKNVTKSSIKFNILDFGDYICNKLEKCIKISTNMPNIGVVICELGFKLQDFLREKINYSFAF